MNVLETPIKLFSDFRDYYDDAFNPNGTVAYVRKYSECMTKSKAMSWLKIHNVPCLDIKPVAHFNPAFNKEVVVYTDPKLHGGKGKILMSCREAIETYPNYLGSSFIEGTDGVSLKFLQVGGRKFHVVMRNSNYMNCLAPGDVVSVEELRPGFNYSVSIPIFSIDYISYNGSMIAVDFNQVQSLKDLGFDKIMTPEEVVKEIEKSIRYHQ